MGVLLLLWTVPSLNLYLFFCLDLTYFKSPHTWRIIVRPIVKS